MVGRKLGLGVALVGLGWGSPATAQGPLPAAPPAKAAPAAPAAVQEDSLSDFQGALDESIVSGASRAAETSAVSPSTTTTIRSEDLQRFGMRTLGDALRFLSVGTFYVAPQGGTPSTVGVRGIVLPDDPGYHVLTFIDGTLEDVGFDLGMPLEIIDHIEVILGAGSVIYGGTAMFGVVNVTTKEARHFSGTRVISEVGASPALDVKGGIKNLDPAGYGVYRRLSIGFGREFTFLGKDGEVTSQAEYVRSDMPAFDVIAERQAAPDPWGGGTYHNVILGESLTDYTRIKWGKLAVTMRATQFQFPGYEQPGPKNMTAVWQLQSLRLNATYSFDVSQRFFGFARTYLRSGNTRNSYLVRAASPTCKASGGTAGADCRSSFDVPENNLGVEVQGTYDPLSDGRFPIMVGAQAEYGYSGGNSTLADVANGKSFGTSGGFSGSATILSVYALERARFSDWLALNAGLRFDASNNWADGFAAPPTQNPIARSPLPGSTANNLSPRVSVIFTPSQDTSLYVTGGTAFRTPGPPEYFFSATSFAVAKGLKPETVVSGEVGIRQKVGGHRGMFSAFVQRADDIISFGFNPGGTSAQFANTGRIDSYGLNASVEGGSPDGRWSYGASVSWAHVRHRNLQPDVSTYVSFLQKYIAGAIPQAITDSSLNAAPDVFGTARVAYDLKGTLPTFALAASVYGPRPTTVSYTSYLPSQPLYPAFGYTWRSNMDPERLDTEVDLRGTVTGPLGPISTVRWRVMGDVITQPSSAYGFGPTPGGNVPTTAYVPAASGRLPPRATAQLFPNNRMSLMLGLEIQLDP